MGKVCRAFFSGPAQTIVAAVAREMNVSPDQLTQSYTRCTANIANARMVAMYLVATLLNLNLTHTGLIFGRDRTTVRHALARVEDKMDDPSFDLLIQRLKDELTVRSA